MAKRSKRRQRSRRTRPRRGRRPRTTASREQPSLGRLIADGTKNLLALVPGAGTTLSNIADLAFKAIGMTAVEITGSKVINAETDERAIVTRFVLTPAVLLVGSRDAIQANAGRSVYTQYLEGRVIRLSISIQPSNKVSERNGKWFLSLNPYFDDAKKEIGKQSPDEQSMKKSYMCVSGEASRPLMLTYRPRVVDGKAFMFNDLQEPYAEVAVRWEQPNREGKAGIDTFAAEINVSGRLELRGTQSAFTEVKKIDTTVNDALKAVGMYLETPSGKRFIVTKDKDLKTNEDESGKYLVSGNVEAIQSQNINPFELESDDQLRMDFEHVEIGE